VRNVRFELADMATTTDSSIVSATPDIVTANLTGALLIRLAPKLLAGSQPDAHLVIGGLLDAERDDVVRAFKKAVDVVDESRDGEWVGLTMKKR
jgi:ribosomal protein L11 methylase PrmA